MILYLIISGATMGAGEVVDTTPETFNVLLGTDTILFNTDTVIHDQ